MLSWQSMTRSVPSVRPSSSAVRIMAPARKSRGFSYSISRSRGAGLFYRYNYTAGVCYNTGMEHTRKEPISVEESQAYSISRVYICDLCSTMKRVRVYYMGRVAVASYCKRCCPKDMLGLEDTE